MNKVGHFESLINELQCLARTNHSITDTKTVMGSELIATIILTRCATILHKATPEQFAIYLDTLTSIKEQGHYALVLKESSRFIELTSLESVPMGFEFLLKEALEERSNDQVNTFTRHDLNATYLLYKRMLIHSDQLASYVSEEIVNLASIFDNPAVREQLAVRTHARVNKLEGIYGAVDAFGYNYNAKSTPGKFHLGSHREPLQSHLFDALASSGTSRR